MSWETYNIGPYMYKFAWVVYSCYRYYNETGRDNKQNILCTSGNRYSCFYIDKYFFKRGVAVALGFLQMMTQNIRGELTNMSSMSFEVSHFDICFCQ